MTGLPASTPLEAVFHANSDSTKTTEATLEELTSHCKNLQNPPGKMHKKVWECISTKREAKRKRMAAKAARPNFIVRDFVLVAVDPQKKISKLMTR